MVNTEDQTLMSPYRVLDLTDDKGMLCGKILGDMGADVIKIEPPGGDPSRMIGPFFHDKSDPEKSLYWFSLNTNKRSITIDIESDEGKDVFKKLVKTADFVIDSFNPGYMDSLGLGYSVLSDINTRIIMTSITPYGQSGPYRDYKMTDLVGMALSGMIYTMGDPDRPPVRISIPQTYVLAASEAVIGTLIAHYHRELTGEGQFVDMSIHESMSLTPMVMPTEWEFSGIVESRSGCMRQMSTPPRISQRYIWPCKDGYVTVTPVMGGLMGAATSRGLVDLMDAEGMAPEFLKEMEWLDLDMMDVSQERYEKITKPMAKFFKKHTKMELYKMAISKGVMLYPVNNVEDVINDTQLQARNFLIKVEHPDLGATIAYPGAFARFSETPLTIGRPPRIGEHNDEILGELADGKKSSIEVRKASAKGATSKKVFDGLKVVEFTWVIAGPWVGKYLAENGAEVIRIETTPRPDLLRFAAPYKDDIPGPDRAPMAAIFNNDKMGITLNLRHPKGLEVAMRLIARADVLVENYTPGTLPKLGLSYEVLKELNPGLIMLSSSNQGQTGPYASQVGFGYQLSSFVGYHNITGWPDREPCLIRTPYTDLPGARLGLVSVLAALDYRRRTGKGQYIDLSQYEAGLQFLSTMVMDYDVNKRIAIRDGNKSLYGAPHAVYPCQGDDRWCAISVFTEEEWINFCEVIGNPSWTKDDRFNTLAGRKENEEELNNLVGEWTSKLTSKEVMTVMQEAGVPAGAVYTCEDLYTDPQLEYRSHFIKIEHPCIGHHYYFNEGFRLSKTPGGPEKPGPCLGEHNGEVYTKILGLSDEEFIGMLTDNVFK